MYIEKLVVKLDLENLENNTDRFKIKFIKLYDGTEVIDEIELNNRTKDSNKFEFTGSGYTISNKIESDIKDYFIDIISIVKNVANDVSFKISKIYRDMKEKKVSEHRLDIDNVAMFIVYKDETLEEEITNCLNEYIGDIITLYRLENVKHNVNHILNRYNIKLYTSLEADKNIVKVMFSNKEKDVKIKLEDKYDDVYNTRYGYICSVDPKSQDPQYR